MEVVPGAYVINFGGSSDDHALQAVELTIK
jgi:hypothetical protein